jgi:hypothetical protein
MKMNCLIHALTLTLMAIGGAQAQSPSGGAVPVTVENFVRAETDLNFGGLVNQGLTGFGKFVHVRELFPVDRKTGMYPNRDTLYSAAVFDLDAGPVTISLPNAGNRYMSMQVIDEDNFTQSAIYGAGSYTFSREKAYTRYIFVLMRTLVDPTNPKDLEEVHALQDAVKVSQSTAGRFEVPNWDQASQKKVRDALLVLGATLAVPQLDTKRMFGTKDQVDPVRHLIATGALGVSGLPEKDAFYLGVTPTKNDGTAIQRLSVKDVPVDGFWSVSVYNSEGDFQPNEYNAYSVNNITATKGADGLVTIRFGGCDGKIVNCLPIVPGWVYEVRLYRPRAEILDGTWTFPQAQPIN